MFVYLNYVTNINRKRKKAIYPKWGWIAGPQRVKEE